MAYDAQFLKDPNAVVDFTRDWSAWLGTDTIATSTWVVPTGLTIGTGGTAPTNTTTTATVWLSGGTAFGTYIVTNRISTTGGRTDDRSFLIVVMER